MIRHLVSIGAVIGSLLLFFAIAPEPKSAALRYGFFDRDAAVAAARTELWAIGDSVRAVNYALARVSAWETARALPNDAAPMRFIALPDVRPEVAANFEAKAREEFASLRATRVPLRVVVQTSEGLGGFYRKYAVLPQEASQPCVVVVQVPPRARNLHPARIDRLLSTCGFLAAFGRPGSGMQQWLEETRGVAATFDSASSLKEREQKRTELVGVRIAFFPEQAACLAGRDDGCAQAFMRPVDFRNQPSIVPASERTKPVVMSFPSSIGIEPGNSLASLRAYLGEARFAQVWASEEDPATAFQTVTGEHIATYVRPKLLRESQPHHPGPLRGGGSLLFGLTIGATATLWAIRRTKRERS